MGNLNQRLNGLNPLSYMGVNATQPPQVVIQTRQPTTNDNGFELGTIWLIPQQSSGASEELFTLIDTTAGSASWVQLYPGAGGGATSFPTDSGTANEAGGDVNIFGGTNIVTSASGNTVTIATSGVVADSFITNPATGTATPSSGVITVAGTGDVTVTASGSTLTINGGTSGTVATLTGNSGGAVSPNVGNINIVGSGSITVVGNPGAHSLTVTPAAGIAFEVHVSGGGIANITGDGTAATIVFDSVYLDTNSAYNNTTGIYTVPSTGTYHLGTQVGYACTPTTGATSFSVAIAINGVVALSSGGGWPTRNLVTNFYGPNAIIDYYLGGLLSLTAGDLIDAGVLGSGGSKVDGVSGNSGNPGQTTRFFGYKIF